VDAGQLLRRLDQRLLPPLARAMARLGRGPSRLRLLTGAALTSVTAVLVAAVWAADQRPAGDPSVGDVVKVGVVEGQSIPGYVASSRTELTRLLSAPPPASRGGETYALVTLSAYLAPDRLTPILGGVSVSAIYARVPLSDTQTSIERISAYRIPDDVVAGMERVAGEKERESADYQDLFAKLTGDGAQEQALRAVYDSGARVAAAEATAYRSRCACVYAAVVRATPAALDQIAKRGEVRAVDPAPEVRRLDRAVFLPPLPEQADVVEPPDDAALAPTEAPAESPSPSDPATTPGPEPSASAEPTATPAAPSDPPAPSSEPTPESTAPAVDPTAEATAGP
jgi:hypothetical protein